MLVIGISGGTGSGKTTMVNQIKDAFPKGEITILSQDSYYNDLSHLSLEERLNINFDHPEAIDFKLLVAHLKLLKENKSIEQPVYSFKEHTRTHKTTHTVPKKVILIEGILILTHPELRSLLDVKIFLHADSDERLARRLKRDIVERGRELDEVLKTHTTVLKPMHQLFIEPSISFADIIIPNNTHNTVAIGIVRTIINEGLS